jgi:hypothetical protein
MITTEAKNVEERMIQGQNVVTYNSVLTMNPSRPSSRSRCVDREEKYPGSSGYRV